MLRLHQICISVIFSACSCCEWNIICNVWRKWRHGGCNNKNKSRKLTQTWHARGKFFRSSPCCCLRTDRHKDTQTHIKDLKILLKSIDNSSLTLGWKSGKPINDSRGIEVVIFKYILKLMCPIWIFS